MSGERRGGSGERNIQMGMSSERSPPRIQTSECNRALDALSSAATCTHTVSPSYQHRTSHRTPILVENRHDDSVDCTRWRRSEGAWRATYNTFTPRCGLVSYMKGRRPAVFLQDATSDISKLPDDISEAIRVEPARTGAPAGVQGPRGSIAARTTQSVSSS